ncbi:phosphate ABC transporter permease subunit PstC [bacterium]|nr:phosphate ABC transporter permease subunit PstC [bacterium]
MIRIGEKTVQRLLMAAAFSAIGGLLLIALFIFKEGLSFFIETGFRRFLFADVWDPQSGLYGIFPMLVASLWVTLGAMLLGAPLGISVAVFLVEFVPRSVMRVVKPTIELLAGIPSVVYGFIGVMVLAPFIRSTFGGPGLSLLAASFILGVMILPTIISISVDAITAVPASYREGSFALGATRWQTVRMVVLKAARSGIIASVILGMGRAVGETMAVIMVAGNAVKIPHSALDSVRTLTANIALEMGYATGRHREALFATGIVLFVVIMILNTAAGVMVRKRVSGKKG